MTRQKALRRSVALLLALAALAVCAPVALADDGTGDTGTTETSPPDTQPADSQPADSQPSNDASTDQEPAAGGSDGGSGDNASDETGSSDGPAEAPADDSDEGSSGGGDEASGETTAPAGDDAAAGDDGSADEAGGAGEAACEPEGEESECPPSEAEADAEEAAEDEESAEGDHADTPKATQTPPPAPAPPAPAPQQSVVVVFNTQPEAPRAPQVSATVLPMESAPTVGRGAGAPLPATLDVVVIPGLLAPAKPRASTKRSMRSIVVASSTQTFRLPAAGSAIALWYATRRAPAGRPRAVLAEAEARAARRHASGPERGADAKQRPREQVMPSWGSDSAFGRGSGTKEKTATAHHRQLAVPVGFRPLATPRETRRVSAPEARPHSASPLSPLERPG